MSVCSACEEESSGYLGMTNVDCGRDGQGISQSHFLFLDVGGEQRVPVSLASILGSWV